MEINFQCLLTFLVISSFDYTNGLPSLRDTPLEPILTVVGEDVLLDCIVQNLDNYTVLWRHVASNEKTITLSAGAVRLINDERISIIHRPVHDTWILRINPAQLTDSGPYICEINTSPPLKVFRFLTVAENSAPTTPFPLEHNYTECCAQNGVHSGCLGFCSLRSLILGGPPSGFWQCTNYLPVITQCLADGRNHMPCCEEQNIPEMCRSVCTGDYHLSTVLQHYTCAGHTIPTLACIAEGVEILPGPARGLSVEPVSGSELLIKWLPPIQTTPVDYFQVNVTELHTFDTMGFLQSNLQDKPNDAGELLLEDANIDKNISLNAGPIYTYNVNGSKTSISIKNLRPLTMYQVQVTSFNKQGSSLPTYAVRTLTVSSEKILEAPVVSNLPDIPDIKSCCVEKGVDLNRCVQVLCDPAHASDTRVTDIMICAPWANVTFECMAGGVDHSPCCRRRGVPDVCLEFCMGTVRRLDYRHFSCLEHMPKYSNCLMEHYGVLSGPPTNFTVGTIHPFWAVLHWQSPKILADTVKSYVVYWREASIDGTDEYQAVTSAKSPFLIDYLKPLTWYEAYVVAVNQYGDSPASSRILFITAPLKIQEVTNMNSSNYNETACCISAGLRDHCMPLCSYQVKLSDLQILAPSCVDDLQVLLRCGAGGRDHMPCCQRRGVSEECSSLCQGYIKDSAVTVAFTCAAEIGKVLQCMEDGRDLLPSPPERFHSNVIAPTSVHLQWKAPEDGSNVTFYQIRYSINKGNVPPHPVHYTEALNVTDTSAIVDNLKPNTTYTFFVASANNFGFSLPSLILVIHTPLNEIKNATIHGTLSPPHSLGVLHHTVDTITVVWQPPLHTPIDAFLSYLIYYQPANYTSDLLLTPTKLTTTFTTIVISNLTLNTEYAIGVKSRTGREESGLSEIIIAWTDPAIPALVNNPLIIPAGPIMEGNNITVLCIGLGIPVPTVSIYVNGNLKSQQLQRHVAYTIAFIQRNVTNVVCSADNGYGVGAHSSLNIWVGFRPYLHSVTSTVIAEEGDTVRLQCIVSGYPEPRVIWYTDPEQTKPVRSSQNRDIQLSPRPEELATYSASIVIKKATKADEGHYYCYAENQYGTATLNISLQLEKKIGRNISACCVQQGVSKECQPACSFDVDIQYAISRPFCMKDLDKLMFCAADGSDHMQCCRQRRVPISCLRWCKGRPIFNAPMCVLTASKEIVACFEEGKAVLPGPPQKVKVEKLSDNTVEIHWDPPSKNPQLVQWYRVVWRPVGTSDLYRNQTFQDSVLLKGLKSGKTYEVAVKAGNHYGLSMSTKPVVVIVDGGRTLYTGETSNTAVKIAVGIVVGILLLVLIGAVAIYFMMRKKPAPVNGVSFDNPTYMKDSITLQNTSFATERNGINTFPEYVQKAGEVQHAVNNIYEDPRTCNGQH